MTLGRMLPLSRLIFVLFLIGFPFAIGLDLIVDADIQSVNGTSYPSLSQAISALIQPDGSLRDTTNTITLKVSCLNVSQYFTSDSIIGTGIESLLIKYEGTPETVDLSATCSQLPTVVISSSYKINFQYMQNVTFVGLNIQYIASPTLSQILHSSNVIFSNFCFNNSEPDYPSLTSKPPSNYYITFNFKNVTNFTMTNGVYLIDALKTVSLTSVSQIKIHAIVYEFLSTTHASSQYALFADNPTYFDTNASITQIRFRCPPEPVMMPIVYRFLNINSGTMSGVSMSDCNFNQVITSYQRLMSVNGVKSFHMDNVSVFNISYARYYSQYFAVFTSVMNLTISNLEAENVTVPLPYYFIHSQFIQINDGTYGTAYPMNISLINWTISNWHLDQLHQIVLLILSNAKSYNGLQIQNISMSNCRCVWTNSFLAIEIPIPIAQTLTFNFPPITINDFKFEGSKMNGTKVFWFKHYYSTTFQYTEGTEIFRFLFSNITLRNNHFNTSTFVTADGFLVSISNLTGYNNNFTTSGGVYLSTSILSSFFLANSQLTDIRLSNQSALVLSNLTTRVWALEDTFEENTTIVFAETRPFIIYNNVFENITADVDSVLVASTNPMVIVQGNILKNVTLTNSDLFQLGKYQDFYTPKTLFYHIYSSSSYRLYNVYDAEIRIFEAVEALIFLNSSVLQEIYNNTRTNIQSYEPENAIFFINVQDNIIESIQMKENSQLIILSDFQAENSSVTIINNTLLSISSDIEINLFFVSEIARLIVVSNNLLGISVAGYLLSFSTPYLDNLVIDSNSFSNIGTIGSYHIEAQKCDTILINNNTVQNSNPENPFISISCDAIDTGVTLQNSHFINITQSSRKRILQGLNLIAVTTKMDSNSGSNQIALMNNVFKNITVSVEEGFTKNVLENSFIFVMSIDSSLILKDNTFDEISITSQGNIFTISIPTIYFNDTKFSNFKYWDVNGAFNMIFYNLSISNCSFESNSGFNSNGAGLMKFSNPSPDTNALNVLVENCTFERNVGSYGTILSTLDTSIQLSMRQIYFVNNYVNETGGLLFFQNIFNSSMNITDCVFESGLGYLEGYLLLKVFTIHTPGQNVNLTLNHSIMTIGAGVEGSFVQVGNQHKVNLIVSNFTLTSALDSTDASKKFSIAIADNVDAIFEDLIVENLVIKEVGLFILNCNMAKNFAHHWMLQISKSSFKALNLSQGLLTINSDEYSKIALENLTILIQDTNFEQIGWSSSAGGIISSTTSLIGKSEGNEFAVTVRSCSFQSLTGMQGLIYNGVESNFNRVLWLDQSIFKSIEVTGGGALVNPSSSLLSTSSKINTSLSGVSFALTNCNVSKVNAQQGAIFYWESQTRGISIILENNYMENIVSTGNGGIISGSFQVSTPNEILMESNYVSIILKNSSYKTISARNGTIIHSEITSQLLNITLEDCTFESITSLRNGGVIYMVSPSPDDGSSIATALASRVLQDITQPVGNLTILDTSFEKITAQNGAIIYDRTPNLTLSILLQNSTFQNVVSTSRGGAFYFNQPVLSGQDNKFSQCSAGRSGQLVYSISDRINLTIFSSNDVSTSTLPLFTFGPTNLQIEFISIDIPQRVLALENYQDFSSNPIIPNLTSYSLSKYVIKLTLIYAGAHGVQKVTDESLQASLAMVFTNQNTNKSQTQDPFRCTNSVCQITPKDITLAGKAGDVVLVDATYTSTRYTQFQQFSITLRGCAAGELNDTAAEKCSPCGFGTYSLDPSDKICDNCPAGAICHGGNNIEIEQNFYRSSNPTRLHIVPCNSSDLRCLGGFNNSCSEAYTGPLCLQCNNQGGYLLSASGECVECLEKNALLIRGALLLLSGLMYQLAMILVTYKSNRMKHESGSTSLRPGAFMVILTSFFQITSIIASFDVGTVSYLLNISVNIGNPNSQSIFSLQCLYDLTTKDALEALQFKLILYVFSPAFKIVVVILFELLRGLVCRDKEGRGIPKSLTRVGVAAVVLIILEQPGIIGALCDYLSCTKLDPYVDEYYITKHNSIQCYTPEYYHLRHVLVIPALIFWGLAIPLVIFLRLRARRKSLFNSRAFRIVFGSFYNNFHQEAYYWGILAMNFKIVIFVLHSILTTSQTAKGLIFMCVFHFYFLLYKSKPPYNHIYLNRAEKYCNIAYMILLTLVLFRQTIENTVVYEICNIISVITVVFTGGYVGLNLVWVNLLGVNRVIQSLLDIRKDQIIRPETLKILKEFHEDNPERIDKYHRRKAVSLELSPR